TAAGAAAVAAERDERGAAPARGAARLAPRTRRVGRGAGARRRRDAPRPPLPGPGADRGRQHDRDRAGALRPPGRQLEQLRALPQGTGGGTVSDPILTSIIANRLRSIGERMGVVVERSA